MNGICLVWKVSGICESRSRRSYGGILDLRTKSKAVKNKAAVRRKLFLISVPFLLFITAFCYVPLLGWVISFFKYYPGIPLNKLEFVGLQNFRFFFSNGEQVLNVVKNTFVLSSRCLFRRYSPSFWMKSGRRSSGSWCRPFPPSLILFLTFFCIWRLSPFYPRRTVCSIHCFTKSCMW